jgi:hypothetical protein
VLVATFDFCVVGTAAIVMCKFSAGAGYIQLTRKENDPRDHLRLRPARMGQAQKDRADSRMRVATGSLPDKLKTLEVVNEGSCAAKKSR